MPGPDFDFDDRAVRPPTWERRLVTMTVVVIMVAAVVGWLLLG